MFNIIVVDDALTERTLVNDLLSREMECEIRTAGNGEAALDYIDDRRPDLVLTELKIPGMNGLEMLQTIKKDYPMIPVVLMPAQGNEQITADAMKAGATTYVPKHRMVEDLACTIKHVIAASNEATYPPQLMHRLESAVTEFTLSNDPVQLESVVAFLQPVLRCLPLGDESERVRVSLVLEAALSNALFHGNMDTGRDEARHIKQRINDLFRERWNKKPWCDRRIHLTAEISRERARFVIRDDGDGFDTSAIDPDVMSLDTKGGRGLPLMYTIMDSVAFNEKGNEVTLIRNRVTGA